MTNSKKIFVLDTNVILHDSSCIRQFDEHDIVIPISVIEELDRFKKGKNTLNCNAREFLRDLDGITGHQIFNGGVEIAPGKGKISIKLENAFHEKVAENFSSAKEDHHIINTTFHLANAYNFDDVFLVTKDVNLRIKAKSIGLKAVDYTSDHVKDVRELYKGNRTIENVEEELIAQLYRLPFEFGVSLLPDALSLLPNENLILRNGSKSALAIYDSTSSAIKKVDNRTCYGIKARNAQQSFALDALMNDEIPLVTISGKAGTGKTLLALAAALENRKHYRQIYLARPVVPLSNKDIGYLPGDINSKLDPYMQPLYDNLAVIQNHFSRQNPGNKHIKELMEDEKIVITPLSYIRGRSIVRAFFIIDEAQNLTPHEVKTIITRAGEGTKIVFTGDVFQIDHPYLDSQSNGLSYLIEKMKGQQLASHINLEKGERSELSDLAINLL